MSKLKVPRASVPRGLISIESEEVPVIVTYIGKGVVE
jgi:hypothetical protein